MALADAVLIIAEAMENKAKEWDKSNCIDPSIPMRMESYAEQLRIAVKASGGNSPITPSSSPSPLIAHRNHIEKAREEMRKSKEVTPSELREESESVRMVIAVNSIGEKNIVPIHPEMGVGNYTNIGGIVYCLGVDGTLHEDPSRTVLLNGK